MTGLYLDFFDLQQQQQPFEDENKNWKRFYYCFKII